jgi:hypothetical protein
VSYQRRGRISGGVVSAAPPGALHGAGEDGAGDFHLTAALTEYGREVHIAAESITVLPWATLEEG